MFSAFNGTFDLVKLIDSQVKSPFPMFSSSAPFMYNFGGAVQLLIPLSVLAGAPLAYYLYQDATGSSSESSWSMRAPPDRQSSQSRSILGSMQYQSQFKTFGGSGQRLGEA